MKVKGLTEDDPMLRVELRSHDLYMRAVRQTNMRSGAWFQAFRIRRPMRGADLASVPEVRIDPRSDRRPQRPRNDPGRHSLRTAKGVGFFLFWRWNLGGSGPVRPESAHADSLVEKAAGLRRDHDAGCSP